MKNMSRMVCGVVVFVFCFGVLFCVPEKATADILGRLKRKVIDSEEIEKQQDAASKAKREAAVRTKAKREERTRLVRLDAEAIKKAREAIGEAKLEKSNRLRALKAEAKEQAKSIRAEKTEAKQRFKQDKKAEGVDEAKLELLKTEYQKALDRIQKRANSQAEETERQKKQIEDEYQEKVIKIKFRSRYEKEKSLVEQLTLPEDTSPVFSAKELRISGNILVSTSELLKHMPIVYNVSDKPLDKAESQFLYDFSAFYEIILNPGEIHKVTARAIQGFTQYIISEYQEKDYAGIYAFVPASAVIDGSKLKDEILLITVLEAPIMEITVKSFDPEQNEKVENIYLKHSAVEQWSPVKAGEVANQKQLDDFVNLLGLNPDRYVSALISKGAEPKTLSMEYNIYEANPWHYFMRIDNSGRKSREWAPTVGLINTNLSGIDDSLIVLYQAKADSTYDENYSTYGSYDFPVMGPRLRLKLYGGHNEFDTSPEGGAFNFVGRGTFYGGILRYNAFQSDGWFFDVTGGLSHERSKVTPTTFPGSLLEADLKMDFWSAGIDLHRSDDMSDTSIIFERTECLGGSDRSEFTMARTGTSPDFIIYSASAAHNQYLDPNQVQRLKAFFRFIGSNERLPSAKMTTFGGMYTVRGYDEEEIVADGGILASIQYEFDLVKYNESGESRNNPSSKKPWMRKLAPLGFIDYGRAKIKDHIAGEKSIEELYSIGGGLILELGDHFTGSVFYGLPLRATAGTRRDKGRLNVGMIMR